MMVGLLVHGEYTLSPGPDGHVVTHPELPNQRSQFARRDPLPKYLQERFVRTRGNGVGPLDFSQPKGAKLAGLEIERTFLRLQFENHQIRSEILTLHKLRFGEPRIESRGGCQEGSICCLASILRGVRRAATPNRLEHLYGIAYATGANH